MRGAFTAALAVIGILCAYSAVAQTFPDVPENHWAYEAISKLAQDGLLKGYPNGTFGGKRILTRYEFAVAINSVYQKLKAFKEPTEAAIADLKAKLDALQVPTTPPQEVSKADKDAIQTSIDALKAQLAGMSQYKTDLENLKRLSSEFEKELASLGVDMKALKQDLLSLSDRVAGLEKTYPKWWLKGDINSVAVGRHGSNNKLGIDWTGTPEGPGGLTKDPRFVNELGLQLGGTTGRDVNFSSDLVISDLLSYEGHKFSQPVPKTEGNYAVILNRLAADWKAEVLGNPMTVEMGRVGNKISPLMLQRPDPDPYIDVPRYDNGEWAMDGGKLRMDFSSVKVDLFGGKQSKIADTNSTLGLNDYQMNVGTNHVMFDQTARPAGLNTTSDQLTVNTVLGGDVSMGFGRSSKFNLGYMFLDGDRTHLQGGLANAGFDYDRVGVFGGGLKVGLAESLSLDANYAQSQLFDNGTSRLNSDNFAYDVGLNFRQGKEFNFGFGYREIRPYFSTPGDWGRIGFWYNPTDIRGLTLGGRYQLSPGMDVTAQGEFYQGTGRARSVTGSDVVVGLGTDDRINRVQLGVGYRVTPKWKVQLGWEGVYWDLKGRANSFLGDTQPFLGGKPTENYYSLGLNYFLGEKTSWRLMYQLTDYDGRGLNGFYAPGSTDTRAKGGILVTQFSLQF